MSYDEQRISDLIDGGIEQMKDLNTASNFATKAVKNLFSTLMKNKRIQRMAKIQKKADDLTVEFCEFLFEEGLICNGCELNPNNCEGSNCGEQMDYFFSDKTKDQIAKLAFKGIGDKYYNQSIKIKNFIKNGK